MNEAAPTSADAGRPGRGAAGEGPLVMIARFRARPGRADMLRSRLVTMVEMTVVEAGCLRYELHVDEGDPEHLVLVEMWRDGFTLDQHMHTRHVRDLLQDLPELAVGDIEMLRLHPVPS